jgi:hypothetical protein
LSARDKSNNRDRISDCSPDRFDAAASPCYQVAVHVTDPSDPNLDRWLREQSPKVELALRYAIRGRFRNPAARRAYDARVDELFGRIAPDADEYAAILRHAREIGEAMEREVAGK